MRQTFVTVILLDIVVIKSREKTDLSEYTLKPNFLRCHQKTRSAYVPCTKAAKRSKDLISSRTNALATRTSSLVWYSRVILSQVELYLDLRFTLLMENRV